MTTYEGQFNINGIPHIRVPDDPEFVADCRARAIAMGLGDAFDANGERNVFVPVDRLTDSEKRRLEAIQPKRPTWWTRWLRDDS